MNNIGKFFIRIPNGVTFDGSIVSALEANNFKIYFDENKNTIWSSGQSFGLTSDEAIALSTLIDQDSNKTIRNIVEETINTISTWQGTDANNVIDGLKEILNWFSGLSEDSINALQLVNRVGKPAQYYTAEEAAEYNEENEIISANDPDYKLEGDLKEEATGLYKLIEDRILNTLSGSHKSGELLVNASAANNSFEIESTSKLRNATNSAETSIQYLEIGGVNATKSGVDNSKSATISKSDLQASLFTTKTVTGSNSGINVSITKTNGEVSNVFVNGQELAERIKELENYNPFETYHDYSLDYLTLVSLEDDNDISFVKQNSDNEATINYSLDNGETWTEITATNEGTSIGNINEGDKILFKLGHDLCYDRNSITSTKTFNLEGNISSLLFEDFVKQGDCTTMCNYTYRLMFANTKVVSIKNLVLPALNTTPYCYYGMFRECFYLKEVMRILPALTLMNNCYMGMFEGCTEIEYAPILPALSLCNDCYKLMFNNCTKLKKVICFAIFKTDSSTSNWLTNVSSNGIFIKSSNSNIISLNSSSGIPTNWTVQSKTGKERDNIINNYKVGDILYVNSEGNKRVSNTILNPSLGYEPIAICCVSTGFFGPTEKARWLSIRYLSTSENSDKNYHYMSNNIEGRYISVGNISNNALLQYAKAGGNGYVNSKTFIYGRNHQIITEFLPKFIDNNGNWNYDELNTKSPALVDINGKLYTQTVQNAETVNLNWQTDTGDIINENLEGHSPLYISIGKCYTLGTNSGDWYIPSLGEILSIAENYILLYNMLNLLSNAYSNIGMINSLPHVVRYFTSSIYNSIVNYVIYPYVYSTYNGERNITITTVSTADLQNNGLVTNWCIAFPFLQY